MAKANMPAGHAPGQNVENDNVTALPTPGAGGRPGEAVQVDETALSESIVSAFERIEELKASRAAVNADIKAEIEGLVAMGLDRDGVRAAFARKGKNESGAAAFMRDYRRGCDALGLSLEVVPPTEAPTKH